MSVIISIDSSAWFGKFVVTQQICPADAPHSSQVTKYYFFFFFSCANFTGLFDRGRSGSPWLTPKGLPYSCYPVEVKVGRWAKIMRAKYVCRQDRKIGNTLAKGRVTKRKDDEKTVCSLLTKKKFTRHPSWGCYSELIRLTAHRSSMSPSDGLETDYRL